MPIRPTTIFLGLILICLTACGGRAARNESRALLEAQSGERWFCQVAEDLESWDCVQSDRLAEAPRPERMPVPRATPDDEVAAGLGESLPGRGLAYDPLAALAGAEAAEAEAEPETELEPEAIATEVAPTTPTDEPEAEAEPEAIATEVAPTPPEPEPVAIATEVAPTPPTDEPEPEAEPIATEAAPTAEDAFAALPHLDVEALPDGAFMIQLVAMRNLETLERVARDRELEDVLAARVAANGGIYYVLLVGPYADEVAAQEIAATPPDQYADFQLWVRSAGSLRQAAQEANALLGES